MKTTIFISGQISGNHTLRNSLLTFNAEEERAMFNGFRIIFQTKKEAKKAMWEAFKELRAAEIDKYGYNASMGGVRYSKFGSLYYDASKAEISHE
jgi:hypothetical protein